jgi:hypothetical protein
MLIHFPVFPEHGILVRAHYIILDHPINIWNAVIRSRICKVWHRLRSLLIRILLTSGTVLSLL